MGDSYHPSRRPDRGGARPSLQDRNTTTSGGGDSYRPNDAQSHHHQSGGQNRGHADFTFSAGGPGPSFPPTGPADDSRPARKNRRARGGNGPSQNSQRDPGRGANSSTSYPGDRRKQGSYPRGGRRAPYRKQAPHERPLLQSRDDTGSEQNLGFADGSNKFMSLDDLSEDETDMDLESDHGSGEGAASDLEPNHKLARHASSTRADGNELPKWSNPEPYTVLPPGESTGKNRDVVKFIRKAKNLALEKAASSNAVAANDDFISLNFDDSDEEEEADEKSNLSARGSMNEAVPTGPATMTRKQTQQHAPGVHPLPSKPQLPPQPQHHKRKRGELEGVLVEEWQTRDQTDATPWVTDYSHLQHDMIKRLHNEIMDFYDFVKPSDHEDTVRSNLILRIESALGTRVFPQFTGHVLCFGSFPARLYLPTADMDLVYATERFCAGGPPALNLDAKGQVNRELWKAARTLENKGVAIDVTVIGRAKVPIIKFVDALTGIKVDLSFENLTGMDAQKTYSEWIKAHPDMVYLVALIKQFLTMRGLNEVHLGGLGGFSIICLVISYVHLKPKANNLGEMFLDFLDYYGNNFNLSKKRLVMNPIQVVNKHKIGIDGRPEKPDSLSIQDPNVPTNNISGGSHKAKQVFQAFAQAHKTLKERIDMLGTGMFGNSVLDSILGGNYESYIDHRNHLLKVEQVRGTAMHNKVPDNK